MKNLSYFNFYLLNKVLSRKQQKKTKNKKKVFKLANKLTIYRLFKLKIRIK